MCAQHCLIFSVSGVCSGLPGGHQFVESSHFWHAMCRSESAHTAQEIIELAARPGELELFHAQDSRTSAQARGGTR